MVVLQAPNVIIVEKCALFTFWSVIIAEIKVGQVPDTLTSRVPT